MKYSDFRRYIKKVNDDQIEEYAMIEPNKEDFIYGLRKKKFVRFSSELFGELIQELRNNPNCSYDTYINEIIKEGYTPEYISVILKDANQDVINNDTLKIGHLREKIASGIMNYFGCKTTYDTLVSVDGEFKCCSVDFNKENETLYIADELKPYCTQIGGLRELIIELDSKFKHFSKEKHVQTGVKPEIDFMREYVYNYLVRKFVLVDRDFGFHNVGIVHNAKANTLSLAPNFDYEYTFLHMELSRNKLFKNSRINDLKFVRKYYSSIYSKFLTKYREFVDENKYEDIIKGAIGGGKKSQRFTQEYKSYLDSVDDMIIDSCRII